jgi:hypothetical protein
MLTMLDLKTYYANAAAIFSFWVKTAGLTEAQACGMVAQADAESSLNPLAVGDHDQAFGLDQWHQARIDAIRNGCGVDLRKRPPLADQLRAALWELKNTEKTAWTQIRMAQTAYQAGYNAARFWERPGDTAQYARRGDKAEQWLVYFQHHPVA